MDKLSNKQKNIINFFESITCNNNFRQQVLFSLEKLFNLEHSTFFLIDSAGNLYDPVVHNVAPGATSSYVKHYQNTDIFHPQNLPVEKHFRNPVMYITDVMSLKKFEQTEYYNDFLKKLGFYHETVITLTVAGKLIGGIGLYKPKQERFDKDIKNEMNLIRKFLERQLSQHLALQRARAGQQIYRHCLNENPIGIILFDKQLSVLFSNNAASEMVSALLHERLNLNQFVKHAVALTGTLTNPSKTSVLSLYSPSLKEFTIRILPADGCPDRKTFLMELIPQDSCLQGNTGMEKPANKNIKEKYGLSERELQVLGQIMQGLTNIEAAQILFISPNTVKAHLRSILKKTGTNSRIKLYQKIIRQSL